MAAQGILVAVIFVPEARVQLRAKFTFAQEPCIALAITRARPSLGARGITVATTIVHQAHVYLIANLAKARKATVAST